MTAKNIKLKLGGIGVGNSVKQRYAGILCLIALAFSLTACNAGFDAVKYMQAVLDNSYKNDSSKYVEMKIAAKEEAEKIYLQGVDANVRELIGKAELSEELCERYRAAMEKIYNAADYSVTDAVRNADKSFDVHISCRKLKVFEPSMLILFEEVNKRADITFTEEELYTWFAEALEKNLEAPEYGEEVDFTIRLNLSSNVYSPDAGQLSALQLELFDIGEMAESIYNVLEDKQTKE